MNNIANTIILVASLITAVTTIIISMQKILKRMFEPVNKKIDGLDLSQARNYLVDFLADIENGEKKDPPIVYIIAVSEKSPKSLKYLLGRCTVL